MIIRSHKTQRTLGVDEPIKDTTHGAPVTRRELIARGFMTGPAVITAPALLAMMFGPEQARAMSPDLEAMLGPTQCAIQAGAGKVPFICFDLAGGANLMGSESLLGQSGNPLNFLSTAGYSKLGLPGNMTPNSPNPANTVTNNFINTEFGAAWHSDGAILRGMQGSTQATTRANTNGFSIAARSENDTGNNPHNPMYGINTAGADGQLLTLIGSQNSDSGGNSMAPASMMNPAVRPTKVDRASDEAALRKLVKCGYLKSTYLADRFRTPAALNPDLDTNIVGAANSIFTQAEYNGDNEFRKTAAIMKMVINGYAGAGTVTMGGFDYHNQGRPTAEDRNFRAGRCIGACLEYAARLQKPLMIYVFSDGSMSAGGAPDMSVVVRGKLGWMSGNQSVASSLVLVHRPLGRVAFRDPNKGLQQQIGSLSAAGDVVTTSWQGANAVNLLVEAVILNYMALHGEQGQFATRFPRNGLGDTASRDAITMFAPVCSGTVSNPA